MKANSSIILGFSVIALILIFTVSVFSLNYKLSTLETKVSESTSKFSSNNYEIDKSQTLFLYVEDRDSLGKYLETSIIKNLEKEGYTVELITEFKENYETQTLLISLPEKDIKYNPFSPSSRIRMLAYYTSSGDTEYFYDFKKEDNPPVVMRSEDGYTGELIIVSKIVLDNTGKGIISLNAYREDLANSLATSVGKIMK